MFSRFTVYFDEVARSGSIRRASERLNISPSAIDRHILLMEETLGVQLFERVPLGLRLTAAGEVLIGHVRRWRRDLVHARSQIDALRNVRRGEIAIALVEGVSGFLTRALVDFRVANPGIDYKIQLAGAPGVSKLIGDGLAEVGITFSPPQVQAIRIERSIVYPLGAVMAPTHPLADQTEVKFADCVEHGMIVPDETISLRPVIDRLWGRAVGGQPRGVITVGSIGLLKSLAAMGGGIGILTPFDISAEREKGELVYVPLSDKNGEISVLALITASGRTLSPPASLLVQYLAETMRRMAEESGGRTIE